MRGRFFCGVMLALAVSSGAASAHHSGAMYDAKTKTTILGTVTDFQWANPHAWIRIETLDPATKKQTLWVFESQGTNQLTRAGWRRDSLKPGDQATIVFNPLRDGEPGGRIVSVSVSGKLIGQPAGEQP